MQAFLQYHHSIFLLAHHFLDKYHDKTEQLSHWVCRPLRKAQMHYAAIDAISLIRLHDEINNMKDHNLIMGKIKEQGFQ